MRRDGVATIRHAAPAKCFTDLAESTDNVAIGVSPCVALSAFAFDYNVTCTDSITA